MIIDSRSVKYTGRPTAEDLPSRRRGPGPTRTFPEFLGPGPNKSLAWAVTPSQDMPHVLQDSAVSAFAPEFEAGDVIPVPAHLVGVVE